MCSELKRWSLTGRHKETGTCCHFIIPSRIQNDFPSSPPPLLRAELFWALYRVNPDTVPVDQKTVLWFKSTRNYTCPQNALPAACLWERHGLWANLSLWKSRWIARRVSRASCQCHYHPVTLSSHLHPLCEVQLLSWGVLLSDLCSHILQNHIEQLSISLWKLQICVETFKSISKRWAGFQISKVFMM